MILFPVGAASRSRAVALSMGAVTTVVVTADQVTKSLVVAGLIHGGLGPASVSVIVNHGATGGIGSGFPVLVTLAAAALTVLAAGLAVRAAGTVTALAVSAAAGGGLGNLADRLFRSPGLGRGGVVDWIHLAVIGGSFDVADLAVLLGVIAGLAAAWGHARRLRRKAFRAARALLFRRRLGVLRLVVRLLHRHGVRVPLAGASPVMLVVFRAHLHSW